MLELGVFWRSSRPEILKLGSADDLSILKLWVRVSVRLGDGLWVISCTHFFVLEKCCVSKDLFRQCQNVHCMKTVIVTQKVVED